MIFENYLIIVTSILILKKINGVETNKFIKIFEEDNNYPRAINLNNKVYAFSGYKSGKITEYNEFAEEIKTHVNFLEYDTNIDIKKWNTNNIIMAWGKNTNIKIINFDSVNWNWSITLLNEEKFYSTTYKINILPIYDANKVIISWINNGILFIDLFDVEDNKFKSIKPLIDETITNINFISCIEVEIIRKDVGDYEKYFLCQYVNDECQIYYIIFDKDYGIMNTPNKTFFYQNSKCYFDKVINIYEFNPKYNSQPGIIYTTKGASCFLNNDKFKCIFWEYNEDKKITTIDLNVSYLNKTITYNREIGIKFMDGCYNWMEQIDVASFDNNKIIATCTTNDAFENRKIKIAIIDYTFNLKDELYNLTFYTIVLNSKGADFPIVTRFSESLYSIFYNIGGVVGVSEENYIKNFKRQKGTNVFEIFDSLLCESKMIQINRGNSITFSIKELLFFGVMNPENNERNYTIKPINFNSIAQKPYFCKKEHHYSYYINNFNDGNNKFCGIVYNNPCDFLDYIYYSLENDTLGFKIFTYKVIYKEKEGMQCQVKIKVCSEECAECDDTFEMCTKCAKGYYQKIETKNHLTFKCYKGDIEKYAFNEITNYYEKCYDTCLTCKKPKNYNSLVGIKSNQQCKTCENNYYFQNTSSDIKIGNCVSQCAPLFGKNESEKKCINCKKYGLYHIKGVDEECKPLDKISKNYYKIINDPYNLVGECVEGSARNNNGNECEKVCNIDSSYWYINSQDEVECTNDLSCNIGYRSILVESNKQCVLSCMNNLESYCSKCIMNELFLFDGKCIENCPINYEKDYKAHTCIPKLKCKTSEILSKQILKEKEYDNIFKNHFYDYINEFDHFLTNNVKIVKGNNYTIELFKNDLCEYEVSSDYQISYVNLTQCQEILVKKNEIKSYDILWIKVDIPKINESNRFYYQAYNIEKEQIIDLTECNDLDVNIEIDFPDSINFTKLKEFYNKGIDLYNANDDFFNDLCFPFYNTDNNDVLISDRRKDYFLNYSFCNGHCDTNLNYENNKINCKCKMKYNNLDNIDKFKEINSSNNQIFKNKNINNEHISCFKCHNVVFNRKYNKKNAVQWVLLGSNFINVISYLYFFFGDLKSINISLGKFILNKPFSNPPKKNEKESKSSKWIFSKNPKKYMKNSNTTNSSNSNVFYQNPSSGSTTNDMESSIRKIKKNDSSLNEIDLSDLSKSKGTTIFSEKNNNNNILNYIPYEDLNFDEAKKLDKRPLSTCLSRIIGKKVIFFTPFCKNYKFEAYSIKIMILLLQFMIISALICLFFQDKFIFERYKKKKSIGFGFTVKQMWGYCILIALITSFIIYILCAIIDNGKNFKKGVQNNKDIKKANSNIKYIMGNYKMKIIIFMMFCFILLGLLWYYVSTFCGVFIKTQKAWFYSLLISIFFIFIIQIFYALILGGIRYKSLRGDNKPLYNIISALI